MTEWFRSPWSSVSTVLRLVADGKPLAALLPLAGGQYDRAGRCDWRACVISAPTAMAVTRRFERTARSVIDVVSALYDRSRRPSP
jgi:hypothetical protein